jgi:hypothetical protein
MDDNDDMVGNLCMLPVGIGPATSTLGPVPPKFHLHLRHPSGEQLQHYF